MKLFHVEKVLSVRPSVRLSARLPFLLFQECVLGGKENLLSHSPLLCYCVCFMSIGNLSIDDGTLGRRRPEVGLSHLRVLRMSVFVNQSSTFCRRRNLTENFVLLKTKVKALSLKLFSQVLYSYLRSCVPERVIERGYITLKCVFSSFCGDISRVFQSYLFSLLLQYGRRAASGGNRENVSYKQL